MKLKNRVPVSYGFISNMHNLSPNTGIDSIFNLNSESTSLIDVMVTIIAEPPLLSTTTLPPPPTPFITHLQQTTILTPTTAPSSSLQDLPNFGSLFGFDHRLKTLETDFSKLKQTNQFATVVSLIPDIVDVYLANKMHESIKTAVQAGKEPESTSAPKKKTSKTTGKSTKGSKSYHKSTDESTQEEEPMQTAKDLEEPAHQEFETGVTEDQPDEETCQLPDWFQKPAKPPTPDHD
ncbi:hypothetical protein Tco_1471574 [Tanacetum coccineum]